MCDVLVFLMIVRAIFLAALFAGVASASALVVPFTEDFAASNDNWSTGNPAVSASWSSSGGEAGGSYIASTGTVLNTGFGAIVFRGNASTDASGDAFVGNWITGGVSAFSAYIYHDAPVALNFYARLDAGAGRAGSSVDFSVPTATWFQLSVPITDAASSFQSYGAGTFATVFNGIQNVQIAISTNQQASVIGQTYNIGLDKVSIVPEPGTVSLLGLAAGLAACFSLRRRNSPFAK